MICKACNYNDETNNEEQDYLFWEMKDVNFEFERQEFSDEKEIMNGTMFVCPKCFTVQILPKDIKSVDEQ